MSQKRAQRRELPCQTRDRIFLSAGEEATIVGGLTRHLVAPEELFVKSLSSDKRKPDRCGSGWQIRSGTTTLDAVRYGAQGLRLKRVNRRPLPSVDVRCASRRIWCLTLTMRGLQPERVSARIGLGFTCTSVCYPSFIRRSEQPTLAV